MIVTWVPSSTVTDEAEKIADKIKEGADKRSGK